LGHTGGTLDKMQAIPGYNPLVSASSLQTTVNQVGCVIAGQTDSLVVADKVLYSLRDITGTVNCDGLILSSIMSKKAAEGIKHLVLDLKIGPSGLFKDVDQARAIATKFIELCGDLGIKCSCVGTRMSHPLGRCVGNALEVMESLEYLKNNNPSSDLHEIVIALGSSLLQSAGLCADEADGRRQLEEALRSGLALDTFRQMLVVGGTSQQHADQLCSHLPDAYACLPTAPFRTPIHANTSGVVVDIDAMAVARVCNALGAGRVLSTDQLDLSVGVTITNHISQVVSPGDVLAELHSSSEPPPQLMELLTSAFVIDPAISSFTPPDIILARFQ
jgi:thymidine phosphorylase